MAWIDDMIQKWWGTTPSGHGGALEYSRSGPYAGFATEGYKDGERVVLDPRLLEIIEVAATEFPLRVVA